MRKVYWVLFFFLLLVAPTFYPASADASGVVIPPGFRKIDSAVGIDFYQKDYPDGSPDYVQVIDLGLGARLKPLHGSITDPGLGQGPYGGNDARFRSLSLSAYWQGLASQDSSAFCVINGQFFYMLEYPTRLPFPLKIDGQIITDGYGIQDFPDKKLMLELWPGKADITALSKEALYSSTAPDIIAGLAEDAPKAKKRYTGRTFIGLTAPNGGGQFGTLLIFNTKTARQVDAADVLKSFGAQKVMMLDGGGSTQLLCRGKSYIYSDRLVPQAIGIVAGVPGNPGSAVEATNLQAATPAVSETLKAAASNPAGAVASPENTPSNVDAAPQDPAPTATQPAQPIQPEQAAPAVQAATPGEDQIPSQENNQIPAEGEAQPALPATTENTPIARDPLAATAVVEAGVQVGSPALVPDQAQGTPPLPVSDETQTPAQAQTNPSLPGETLIQPAATLQPAAKQKPASQAAGQQPALAAGMSPVRLDDVLWVPVGMAPVLMILLFGIFKVRGRGV